MKHNFAPTFDSRPSAFQPIWRRARSDNDLPSVTLPPGVPSGSPIMRSITRQPLVDIVWPKSVHNSLAVMPSLTDAPLGLGRQEAGQDSVQSFLASQANELRKAIVAKNHEVLQKILSSPAASEIGVRPMQWRWCNSGMIIN